MEYSSLAAQEDKFSLLLMTKEELFEQAHYELAKGNLVGARDAFQKCVEHAPDDPEAWNALAMANLKLNDPEAAITAGIRATELNPNEPLYWTSLSLAFARCKRTAEAEAAAAKAKVLSWGGKLASGGWDALRQSQKK